MQTVLPLLVKIGAVAIVLVSAVLLLLRVYREFIAPPAPSPSNPHRHRNPSRPARVETYEPLPRKTVWGAIIGVYLATRALIFLASLSYAAATSGAANLGYTLGSWWYEYDSYHYINIAENGYQSTGDDQVLIVFYPFYPFLIRLLHYVIPDFYVEFFPGYTVNGDYYVAAILLSNAFLLIGMYYLVRLVEREWRDAKLALASVKYWMLFPVSFFFSIVYTESVFVALCILSFYHMRRSRWWIAGLFGLFAALTRNQGVLLVIPLLVEMALQQEWGRKLRERRYGEWLRGVFPSVLSLALPVIGIGIYLLVNKVVSGDWFRFLVHQEQHWGQTFGFFAENLAEHMRRALTYHKPLFNVGVYLPQITAFFLAFGLLIYMTNKIRLSYALYSFAYLIISYSASALLSGTRYVAGLFTMYMFLAYVSRRMSSNGRSYLDWVLLAALLFFTVVFGLNYVF